MVGAEGIESAIKRVFNNMQGTAGTLRHRKALENNVTDRQWIASKYTIGRIIFDWLTWNKEAESSLHRMAQVLYDIRLPDANRYFGNLCPFVATRVCVDHPS